MALIRSEGGSGRTAGNADESARAINTRLAEAAARGETLEVILVLRGKVRVARGSDRWRIREAGGRVLTFRATAVVAATPVRARGETSSRLAGRTRVLPTD
jgi:hypothetical protein